MYVWRTARPTVFKLNQALSPDLYGSGKPPTPLSLSSTKRLAQTCMGMANRQTHHLRAQPSDEPKHVWVWRFISRLSQALNPDLYGSGELSDSRLEIFYSDESSIFYPNNTKIFV